MKKLFMLLSMAIMIALHNSPALAYDLEANGIYYNYTEQWGNREAYLSVVENPNKYSGDITIPEEVSYNGTPVKVKVIEQGAFYGCTDVTSVKIPKGITKIQNVAFYGCEGLRELNLPDDLEYIGSGVFQRCNGLISITIPEKVSTMYSGCFWGCTKLKSVEFKNRTPVNIHGDSFLYVNMESCALIVPDGCKEIYEGTQVYNYFCNIFEKSSYDYSKMRPGFTLGGLRYFAISDNEVRLQDGKSLSPSDKVEIPSTIIYNGKDYTVTKIGITAFSFVNIKELTIPNTIKVIESGAFDYCSHITELTIPESVEIIDDEAFAFTSSAKTLNLGSGLKRIGEEAFYACGISSLIVPENVTFLGAGAFNNCKNLETADLQCNVESLPYYILENCTSLKSAKLSDHIKTLQGRTFFSCSSLTDVTLPSGLETIGDDAFTGCTALKEITLPATLKDIRSSFKQCTGLERIESHAIEPPTAYSDAFDDVNKEAVHVTVPKGSVFAYQTTRVWRDFRYYDEFNIPVTGLSISISDAEMTVGETLQLTIVSEPADATIDTPTWWSDKTDIATVSEGLVTALSPGKTDIWVKVIDGDSELTARCSVTVKEKPIDYSGINNCGESAQATTIKDGVITSHIDNQQISIYTPQGTMIFSGILNSEESYRLPLGQIVIIRTPAGTTKAISR